MLRLAVGCLAQTMCRPAGRSKTLSAATIKSLKSAATGAWRRGFVDVSGMGDEGNEHVSRRPSARVAASARRATGSTRDGAGPVQPSMSGLSGKRRDPSTMARGTGGSTRCWLAVPSWQRPADSTTGRSRPTSPPRSPRCEPGERVRAVIDANVWVSGLIVPQQRSGPRAWSGSRRGRSLKRSPRCSGARSWPETW